jgi:hypothetical protein
MEKRPVLVAYVPGVQDAQTLKPTPVLNVPALQLIQVLTDVMRDPVLYFPFVHREHVVIPVAVLYDPAGQLVQTVSLVPLVKVPLPHVVHINPPPDEYVRYVPALQ